MAESEDSPFRFAAAYARLARIFVLPLAAYIAVQVWGLSIDVGRMKVRVNTLADRQKTMIRHVQGLGPVATASGGTEAGLDGRVATLSKNQKEIGDALNDVVRLVRRQNRLINSITDTTLDADALDTADVEAAAPVPTRDTSRASASGPLRSHEMPFGAKAPEAKAPEATAPEATAPEATASEANPSNQKD